MSVRNEQYTRCEDTDRQYTRPERRACQYLRDPRQHCSARGGFKALLAPLVASGAPK